MGCIITLDSVGESLHNADMFDHKKAKALVGKSRLKKSFLASESTIKEATLSRYLNGDGHPSPAVIKLLAKALEVPESELTIATQETPKAS